MATEDLSTFAETDAANDITLTAPKCAFDTMYGAITSHVEKDYTAGHFGDYDHDFEVQIDAWDTVAYLLTLLWGVTNNPGGVWPATGIMFLFHGYNRRFLLYEMPSTHGDTWDNIGIGTLYYCAATRTGTDADANIYSDAARTNLLKNLSIVCAQTTFRYAQVLGSQPNGGSGWWATGFTQNLDLNEAGGSSRRRRLIGA